LVVLRSAFAVLGSTLVVLAGAAAVGILAAWCAQRWGAVAGFVAGATLAANPMFASLARNVRGYSLMVLGVTIATMIFVDAREHPESLTRARRIGYAAALGIAIGTGIPARYAGYLTGLGLLALGWGGFGIAPDIWIAGPLSVVGGIGTVWGPIFGAILYSTVQDQLTRVIVNNPYLPSLIYGVLLVVIVMFEPLGIAGLLGRAVKYARKLVSPKDGEA